MAVTEEIAARYGRTPSRRRRMRLIVVAVAALLVAAGAAWIVWVTSISTATGVEGTLLKNNVVDDRAVTLTFRLDAPSGDRPVSCALEAMDGDYTVVGWKVVTFPADGDTTSVHEERVRTVQPARTGLISSCWVS